MHRIVVFGNSGSGKTTYALARAKQLGCDHMDLDTVAWEGDSSPPKRRETGDSLGEIRAFLEPREEWVVEGCYADLLEYVTEDASELVFLNPGVEACIQNARRRPWEPHKYASPEAQDENLEMLCDWIAQYERREDEFSLTAHRRLFDGFHGRKREYRSNRRD